MVRGWCEWRGVFLAARTACMRGATGLGVSVECETVVGFCLVRVCLPCLLRDSPSEKHSLARSLTHEQRLPSSFVVLAQPGGGRLLWGLAIPKQRSKTSPPQGVFFIFSFLSRLPVCLWHFFWAGQSRDYVATALLFGNE